MTDKTKLEQTIRALKEEFGEVRWVKFKERFNDAAKNPAAIGYEILELRARGAPFKYARNH